MRRRNQRRGPSRRIAVTSMMILALAGGLLGVPAAGKDEPPATASAEFLATMNRKAAQPHIMKAAKELLEQRYDLSGRTDPTVRMSGGKPVPVGPTARLPKGMSWDDLAKLSPDEINLVLGLQLTTEEQRNLVAYLRVL